MEARRAYAPALGFIAAASGIGFSTGRELALFFAQLGGASWAGIALASMLYGLLCGAMLRYAQPLLAAARGTDGLSRAFRGLNRLMAAVAAAAMLSRPGQLGAIALPLRHGYAAGVLAALALALAAARRPGSWLPAMGTMAAILALTLFSSLALDPRPVRAIGRGSTVLRLAGSMRAATALAVVYAAMAACAGLWTIPSAGVVVRPGRVGVRAGVIMAAILCAGNAALQRGGSDLIARPEPLILLLARWGIAGFWLCAVFSYLCAASTLSAATAVLLRRDPGPVKAGDLFFPALAAVLLVVLSHGGGGIWPASW